MTSSFLLASRPARARLVAAALAIACLPGAPIAAQAAEDCFARAGAYQGVNPLILRAIAWYESKGNPDAVHRNADGSIDVGQAQINSVHFVELRRYGVPPGALKDPCVNTYVAAWMLKQKMIRYGNTWHAIGAYHSETPSLRDQYARSIHGVLVSWGMAK
ncbi:lytic transglycosylase domain-containing protein [Trinickia acidisoli]|uniref:lytic transglycosylase domain-containing protein n=1 Tax=Trinickia acidisoli TaxID=2767482 RepID=UPI001A8DF38C|nr:lytic transglycosylase domain-containing protein [Trinickia acidisoli]